MKKHEYALRLAERGFYVFPLLAGDKLPAIDDFPNRATRDRQTILQWWNADETPFLANNYNVGIYCGRFGDEPGVSLCVIDVDKKNGRNGGVSLLKLEMQGLQLPATYTQATPTGGSHLVYLTRDPVRNRVAREGGKGSIGEGLDIRGVGGFIVAAGSATEKGVYCGNHLPVAEAPAALVALIHGCGGKPDAREPSEAPVDIDQERAEARAKAWLQGAAPLAVEGAGGDQTTFSVAAKVKDFGVAEAGALDLLLDHWNDRCSPPWSPEDLAEKVANAYRYGTRPVGAAAPEAEFTPVPAERPALEGEYLPHPDSDPNWFNLEYAFVVAGGGHHILHETTDVEGNFLLDHLNERTFFAMHTAKRIKFDGAKTATPLTKLWMESPAYPARPDGPPQQPWRRTYRGLCFRPGLPTPEGFYNTWRGFVCAPLPRGEEPEAEHRWAVEAWIEHVTMNVCRGDRRLARWVIGWFAHLIQRPHEKPLTALVLRGGKGVGKNAVVERVADLLGCHAMVTAERRYLVGNFNGHMESLLLFGLDEAVWAGDKQGEGVLKGLVTGSHHVIERKGAETYRVENRTRVVILGNENWLVPASYDERRYAVFDVGDGRKQDREFFARMKRAMRNGGNRYFLRYLLDYDLTGIDVNEAPVTAALTDQKIESLETVHQFWFSCLQEGAVTVADLSSGEWPTSVRRADFRAALRRYASERNIRSRVPNEVHIGRDLRLCCPGIRDGRLPRSEGQAYTYVLPPLAAARAEFEKFIGAPVPWNAACT